MQREDFALGVNQPKSKTDQLYKDFQESAFDLSVGDVAGGVLFSAGVGFLGAKFGMFDNLVSPETVDLIAKVAVGTGVMAGAALSAVSENQSARRIRKALSFDKK